MSIKSSILSLFSVQIPRTHSISEALQLCPLAQFSSSYPVEKFFLLTIIHSMFDSLPVFVSIQRRTWRIRLEQDQEHFAQATQINCFGPHLRVIDIFSPVQINHTEEKNTPGFDSNWLNAATWHPKGLIDWLFSTTWVFSMLSRFLYDYGFFLSFISTAAFLTN